MRVLTGDIGGTNARLVLYEAPDDVDELRNGKSHPTHRILSQMFYKNNDFASFTEVLCSFFALPGARNLKVHTACLAVAGPVADNHINFTNREGWIIDGDAISEDFGIDHVQLINDFVANGYGLLSLSDHDLTVLQEGAKTDENAPAAPIALVGAGTGLGECFLTPDPSGLMHAFPSEGGHVEFAPRTELEEELLHFLQKKLDNRVDIEGPHSNMKLRVSVERVVSGKGLENIYEFLRAKYPEQVNAVLDADYTESNERGRLIGSEKYNYNLFSRALEMMFAIYGGEVGNVALKFLPFGGLYIAGGIAPKNIEFITGAESEFTGRFLDKGRMRSIMSEFPVYVVMKEDLGLRGAHGVASRLAAEMIESATRLPEKALERAALPEPSKSTAAYLTSSLRDAVTSYPITYAVVTSTTAALTAAGIYGVTHVVANRKSV